MSVMAQYADQMTERVAREPHDSLPEQTTDGLRLLGLSRIPRCARCPRLGAMMRAYREGERLESPCTPAPRFCRHQVCAPMVRRLQGDA
jgi:hypothetical protein